MYEIIDVFDKTYYRIAVKKMLAEESNRKRRYQKIESKEKGE